MPKNKQEGLRAVAMSPAHSPNERAYASERLASFTAGQTGHLYGSGSAARFNSRATGLESTRDVPFTGKVNKGNKRLQSGKSLP